jgi:hypothetical protein
VAQEEEAVSPLMGRKPVKLLCCPHATVSVQSIHAQNDSVNDVTSVEVAEKYDIRIQFDDHGYS